MQRPSSSSRSETKRPLLRDDPTGWCIAPAVVDEYVRRGWWGTLTLSDYVRRNCRLCPDDVAFIDDTGTTTWRGYNDLADQIGASLIRLGYVRGDHIGVLMGDSALLHAALLGCERAGVTALGIGARSGDQELRHLIAKGNARALLTRRNHRGVDMAGRLHGLGIAEVPIIDVEEDAEAPSGDELFALEERSLGPNELFLLNSTSGTTGMPKLVKQFQNRWFYFCQVAIEAANIGREDRMSSLVPMPFGFGIWTAHFLPAIAGIPTIVAERFSAATAIEMLDRERPTLLAAVSTQFIQLLNNSLASGRRGSSSVRVLYTGGEAVPMERAKEFEERFGAEVLQFYGSNETGALSCTRLGDPQEVRFTTAGHVLPEMQVRLFDESGDDVTALGGPAQAGAKGPALCPGYYDDPAADHDLIRPDGWMLMGDYVTLQDSLLSVVGRLGDFIIRGGKNIAAAAVEAMVSTHPAVELVAAIAVPDPVFGERVCAVVTVQDDYVLTLEALREYLATEGVTKEIFPEYLCIVESMPLAAGGKIAKGDLRQQIDDLLRDSESAP